MKYTSRRGGKAGFTLIELLVVIAIIAILAGILFPVLVEARRAGYKASCMSQMRQINTAVTQYSTDRGNRLPPSMYNIMDFTAGQDTWSSMCTGYFKGNLNEPKTWILTRCPATRGNDPANVYKNAGDGMCWWWNWALSTNPGDNHVYLSPYDDEGNAHPITTADAASPTKTILFAESGYPSNQAEHYEMYYGYFTIDPPTAATAISKWTYGLWDALPWGCVYPRHSGLANVIWLDGHCSALRIGQFKNDGIWDLQ